ncbi:MAG: PilC/PilY family type IV pilus protein [Thermodesulfobacteriota bacterium]|nr:PilC/PilY family type IV pilus protein [Thermodesulfobacteriota bacterium]
MNLSMIPKSGKKHPPCNGASGKSCRSRISGATILFLGLLLSVLVFSLPTWAEDPDFGDSDGTAEAIAAFPYSVDGDGDNNGDQDWFTFTTGGDGSIDISVRRTGGDQDVYLYNAGGTRLAHDDNSGWWSSTAYISRDIPADTYYIIIVNHDGWGWSGSSSYNMNVDYEADLSTWYRDEDEDGYGDPTNATSAEDQPSGYVADNTDCDDNNSNIHPGMTDGCDQVDNDCDGDIDEDTLADNTYYRDIDGDGYGNDNDFMNTCQTTPPNGYVVNGGDCDDNDGDVHPGAFDVCENGIDEDCSGSDRPCSESAGSCAAIADVPLETDVEAAPPLVMFVMDDSGSMAWDTLCPEDNGLFGGVNYVDDARSYWKSQWSGYNGIYYDPDMDYAPWPDSVTTTYGDADPDTPRRSPDSGNTQSMDAEYTNIGGSWSSGTSVKYSHYYVWSSNAQTPYLINLYNGNVDYYEVSYSGFYGQIDSLTNVTGSQPADVTISRSYAEERQNYANWYKYYRNRQQTAIASIAQVIDGVNKVKIGLHVLNDNDIYLYEPRVVDASLASDGDDATTDYRKTILAKLYKVGASGGTPLRQSFEEVGEFYARTGTDSPFNSEDDGGICQQAFTIVMTDGYYNGNDPSVGNADGDGNTNFDGAPFADSSSNTLADVAMHYYERDLNPALADSVPITSKDTASHQHMVTYTVSFGLTGTLDPDAHGSCPSLPSDCPDWPAPTSDQRKIDDMWHAAVNGRGSYMSAANYQQLIQSLEDVLNDVVERRGSGASVSVSSQTLQEETLLFKGSYNSAGWTGDLVAYPLTEEGGMGNQTWSAAEELNATAHTQRNIFTMADGLGVSFEFDNLTDAQKAMLGDDAASQELMVNFIRGDKSNDTQHGGAYRYRDTPLGDIVHSAPVLVGDALFVGANDGMLHAFNATPGGGGQEIAAYIPSFVFPNMEKLADPYYSHKYFVDGTPFVAKLPNENGGYTYPLVGGLGKGGKGYYCLDVSGLIDGSYSSGDMAVEWEYPTAASSQEEEDSLGYSFSRPVVVETDDPNHKYVVIFGNGYGSATGRAQLFVLDIDGTFIRKIDTGVGDTATLCNGLSTPAVIDIDYDGVADTAYAGDLLGNLWRFDLSGDDITTDWDVAYKNPDNTNAPLFTAVADETGEPQPITSKPAVMPHCLASFYGFGKGHMVVFGTGKFISANDFDTNALQSVYGIWDWREDWKKIADESGFTELTLQNKFLGTLMPGNNNTLTNLNAPHTAPPLPTDVEFRLLSQGITGEDEGAVSTTSEAIDDDQWFKIDRWLNRYYEEGKTEYTDEAGDTNVHYMGWRFDLSHTGERVISDAMTRAGMALFVSLVPSRSACESGGHSYYYALNACSGSAPKTNYFRSTDASGLKLNDIYYPPVVLPPGNPGPEQEGWDFFFFGDENPMAAGLPNDNAQQTEGRGMSFWRPLRY